MVLQAISFVSWDLGNFYKKKIHETENCTKP